MAKGFLLSIERKFEKDEQGIQGRRRPKYECQTMDLVQVWGISYSHSWNLGSFDDLEDSSRCYYVLSSSSSNVGVSGQIKFWWRKDLEVIVDTR